MSIKFSARLHCKITLNLRKLYIHCKHQFSGNYIQCKITLLQPLQPFSEEHLKYYLYFSI